MPITVTPVPTPDCEPDAPLATIQIKRAADDGNRLKLYVDARRLHKLLDDIGVPCEGNRYMSRPPQSFEVANRQFQLSTEVLLRKEYPAAYSLSNLFDRPPSAEQLDRLARSAYEAIRTIREHYQPIDIKVTVHAKKGA